jgi:AraC family transcriptional regulator, transcriptional activator of pobA
MKNIPVRKIAPPQSESSFPEGFSIRRVQDLAREKDLTHDLHRHDFFFVLAVEKGSGNHEIDFVAHNVTNNNVFILRPGQVHQLFLQKGTTGYLMEFSPDFYQPKDTQSTQVLNRVSNKNLCELHSERLNRLYSILAEVLQEYQEQQEGYLDVIKANLGVFFIELLRHRQNKSTTLTPPHSYEQEQLDRLLQLIEKNLSENKQVQYYADILNLSSYQLNSITKAMLGKTCSEIINEQIILEARRYLLATSNQVTQIAFQLGYDDPSYFIRFFKKHTGYSPDSYRQNFK